MMAKPVRKIIRVPLEQVIFDEDLQSRVGLDRLHLEEMRTWLVEHPSEDMDPVSCIRADGEYLGWDGFHRRKAYEYADRPDIPVEWTKGTKRDAWKLSLGANAKHGLKRTNADKRKVVCLALEDDELAKNSSLEIAAICGVSKRFVNLIKADRSGNVPTEETAGPTDNTDLLDDGDEVADAVDDARAHLEQGEEWHRDAIRLVTLAHRFGPCKDHLAAIDRALHELWKVMA
jgi:hypothetical protein